jgi:alpha-D-ribose 1-methylphosphonate 5-triphosphate synthase subunit PhnG
MQTSEPGSNPEMAARQRRLRLLARAERNFLEACWTRLPSVPVWRKLKPPETGLAMVRARAGGSGQPFNFGEMTLSRCVVALEPDGVIGVGYVQGRDQRKAELVALFDALSQRPESLPMIEQDVILPVERQLAEIAQIRREKVAATKVDFFTMVRGED